MGLIRKLTYVASGGVVAPRSASERRDIRMIAAMQGKSADEIRRAGGRYDFDGFWARGGITDVNPAPVTQTAPAPALAPKPAPRSSDVYKVWVAARQQERTVAQLAPENSAEEYVAWCELYYRNLYRRY